MGVIFCFVLFMRADVAQPIQASEKLILTREEQQYIAEAPTIGVSVSPNKGPLQYLDTKTAKLKGISVDYFEELSRMTGLQFHYVNGKDVESILLMMQEGEISIVSGMPQNLSLAQVYQTELSNTYLESPIAVVMPHSTQDKQINDRVLAISVGMEVDSAFKNVKEIIRYNTVEDCIQAVGQGKADFTYGNAYVMEYYAKRSGARNLTIVPLNQRQQDMCIGVAVGADERLLSILNKAIQQFSDETMQNIIMNNTARPIQQITLSSIVSSNPVGSIVSFVSIILLILMIAFILITKYQKQNRQIALANRKYTLLSDISNEYLYEYDYVQDCMILSTSLAALFDSPHTIEHWKEFTQKTGYMDMIENKKVESLYSTEKNTTKQEAQPNTLTLRLQMKDGRSKWFRMVRAIIYEENVPKFVIGKMSDIQKEQEEREELIEKSSKDGLTKLYNAETSRELINQYITQERQIYGTLMILDIDDFKGVNDKYGHYMGDKVLQEVGNILLMIFRKDDIVGRLGGDEFLVFMKDLIDRQEVKKKCEQLQSRIQKIDVGNEVPITASMGVSIVYGTTSFDFLYQQTDKALYEMKENGKSGYKIVE